MSIRYHASPKIFVYSRCPSDHVVLLSKHFPVNQTIANCDGQRNLFVYCRILIHINPKGIIHIVCGDSMCGTMCVESLHCEIQKYTRAHLLLKALFVIGSASDIVVSVSSE